MRPAIVYAAKSTYDPRGSIPTQLADGRELAANDGLTVVAEYADENRSAYHGNRGRDLARAQAHAEDLAREHGECALIIQHSDRLARGDGIQAAHLVEYALWAIKASVKLRSVQDPQTFGDLLYTVVTGQRNHEDSRRKGLAVRDGLERRARKGLVSTRPPYGYRYRDRLADEEAELEIIPEQAAIVRRIFAEFLAGRSMTFIARGLHRDGVRTRDGGLWRQSTVTQMLPNPIYAGMLRYHDEILPGRHEAIIDPETWARAQQLLAARPARGRGRLPKGNHLFRGGMLRCGECGWGLIPRTNGRGHQVYYCGGRHAQGREFCSTPHLWRSRIDQAVFNYFAQVALDIEATRRTLAESNDRKLAEIASLRSESEREAQLAEERYQRVRRDYTNGDITAAEWRELRDDLQAERDAAQAQADRHRAAETQLAETADSVDAEHAALQQLAEIRRAIADDVQGAEGVEAVRAALARLFEAFVVHRSTPRRVHVELIGEWWIEPIVRGDMLGESGPSGMPTPQREALDLSAQRINSSAGAGGPSAPCGPTGAGAGARATASAFPPGASASAPPSRARRGCRSRRRAPGRRSSWSPDRWPAGRRAQPLAGPGVAAGPRCRISSTISRSMRAISAIRSIATPAA